MFGLSSLYIKLIGIGLMVLLIGGLLADRSRWEGRAHRSEQSNAEMCAATRSAANRPKLDCKQTAEQIKFLGDALGAVQARTLQAKANDAAHAKLVETDQTIAGKESSNDYQTELARVRADYNDRLRRAAASTVDTRSGGKSSVSSAAATTQRSCTTTAQAQLPSSDGLIATEQALQLQAIIDWGKKVGIISP